MEIELIKRISADSKNTILVIGVFHGDEPQGEYLINEYLKLNHVPQKNSVYYIPRLNLNNERKNKNGVDLNRNFPTKNWELGDIDSHYFGGHAPASEDEVKFLVDLIDKNNFSAILTIHSPFKVINYDPNSLCAKNLADNISKFISYPVKSDIGYPTPGSFGTYAGIERNIPVITLEVDEEIDVSMLFPNFKNIFSYLEDEYVPLNI